VSFCNYGTQNSSKNGVPYLLEPIKYLQFCRELLTYFEYTISPVKNSRSGQTVLRTRTYSYDRRILLTKKVSVNFLKSVFKQPSNGKHSHLLVVSVSNSISSSKKQCIQANSTHAWHRYLLVAVYTHLRLLGATNATMVHIKQSIEAAYPGIYVSSQKHQKSTN
jgi:hypothetical protein